MYAAQYLKMSLKISANVYVVFLATNVLAQECTIADLSSAPTGKVVETAQANMACLLSKIDALATELAPFREAKGVVLAFDRSEDRGGGEAGGACPIGWTLFREAGGRFILGAGNHANVDMNGLDLEIYPAFKDNQSGAIGGEEKHELSLLEIPPHNHSIELQQAGDGLGLASSENPSHDNRVVARSGDIPFHLATGYNGGSLNNNDKADPHNNMPPYIALYFCRMEQGG